MCCKNTCTLDIFKKENQLSALLKSRAGQLMKCSALATIASVTSLTVLETVLLSNPTENDKCMVVIYFKLVANR